MKTPVFLLMLLVLSQSKLHATAQMGDKLIYSNSPYMLFTNPMSSYFSQHTQYKQYVTSECTSLWRGYVATFAFSSNRLLLIDVEVLDGQTENLNSIMSKLFSKPLFVDWFSGLLVVPYGELVEYTHMGYASIYENYLIFEIKNGELKRSKRFSYLEYAVFRKMQFAAFRKTQAYTEMFMDMKKRSDGGGMPDDQIDRFIEIFVIEYTSEILDDE